MTIRFRGLFSTATGIAAAALGINTAMADAVSDFYSGKTIILNVGSGEGGGFGLNARVISNYLQNNIPGKPTIVLQFMQGSGGVKAANYIYNVASRDGSVIHMPISSIVENQMLRPKGVKFDGSKFNWLGSVTDIATVLSVWHTSPVTSLEEAKRKEVVLGSPSGHSFIYRMPKLMNELLGTRFKIIVGYKGSRGVTLAMERGEVHGRAMVWASTKARTPHHLREGKLIHFAQLGPRGVAELPNVPRLINLAPDEKSKSMVRFLQTTGLIGRALLAPPGTPRDRVDALRAAFDATVKNPDYAADLKKRKLPLRPTSGAELQKFIESVVATPMDLITQLRRILDPAKAEQAQRKK